MSTVGTAASFEPIVLTAPSGGAVRGLTYVNGDTFAVAMESADEDKPFAALVAGPVWASKDPTLSIEAGAHVYLDTDTGLVTSDDSKTEIGGFCLRLAGTADEAVCIMLGQPNDSVDASGFADDASASADAADASATAADASASDAAASAASIIGVPTLPGAGTFTLKCIDGTKTWVEDA